jgi:putative transcriptional regulator
MKNNLKVHRAIYNLTQAALARKIGVSRQTVNTMERGKFIPSTILALKLAKVFKATVEEIFLLETTD